MDQLADVRDKNVTKGLTFSEIVLQYPGETCGKLSSGVKSLLSRVQKSMRRKTRKSNLVSGEIA